MSKTRVLRIGLLLFVLLVSLILLLRTPFEPQTLIETHWERLSEEPQQTPCPAVPLSRVGWRLRFQDRDQPPHDWGFPGLLASARANLFTTVARCEADCNFHHEILIAPEWRQRPGFFTGLAEVELQVRARRTGPGCEERYHWTMKSAIDTGRRGEASEAIATTGRLVADFLGGAWCGRLAPSPLEAKSLGLEW